MLWQIKLLTEPSVIISRLLKRTVYYALADISSVNHFAEIRFRYLVCSFTDSITTTVSALIWPFIFLYLLRSTERHMMIWQLVQYNILLSVNNIPIKMFNRTHITFEYDKIILWYLSLKHSYTSPHEFITYFTDGIFRWDPPGNVT